MGQQNDADAANSPQFPFELAKQGDPNAIAVLINRTLTPKGMLAKVKRTEGCLTILVEGNDLPHKDNLVSFIRNGIANVDIAEITYAASVRPTGRS